MSSTSTFQAFDLNKQLLTAVAEAGYQTPTAIQARAIPIALGGHDVLGIAQTGTGKTAAYVLPLLMKVKYAQGNTIRALILAPTRELALQINEHLSLLGKYTDLRHAAIYGGIGPTDQINAVEQGLDVLVATPGRFLDLYAKGHIAVKAIATLILDEADKMMDMGFMPQIRRILEVIPHKKRQNMLFSATMPQKVLTLSEEFLEFPHTVEVTPQATPAQTVAQHLYQVPNLKTKILLTEWLFQHEPGMERVIIFTKTKETANNLFKYLSRKITGELRLIHGNKGQNTRINSIEAFKSGQVRILVATDVVARGIDVSMVTHVINLDVPMVYEDYVHRIGRTGRAQHSGVAISMVNPAELYHIKKIEGIIQRTIPEQPLPGTLEVPATEKDEAQEMAREIDRQKRKEDPNFKGAFHEAKVKKKPNRHRSAPNSRNKGAKKKH